MRTYLLVGLLLLMLAVPGCIKKEAMYNPLERRLITPEEYQDLPADEKAEWEAVVTTEVDPQARAEIDAAVADVKETHDVFSPYLPEPIRTPLAVGIGFLGFLWQTIRKKRISLGARITAANLEATVAKEAPKAFARFKEVQATSEAAVTAVMPDKVKV